MDRQKARMLVRQCMNCRLHSEHSGPVPFRGPAPADLCVIGEAPGYYEDRDLAPFVGNSGIMAEGLVKGAGINLDTVAWMNVVSCWPGRIRRTPTRQEVDACERNVRIQLASIRPRYCLVFGGMAASTLTGLRASGITELRGLWFRIEYEGGEAWALSTWHPAAILRRPSLVDEAEGDVLLWAKVARKNEKPELNQWCFRCTEYPEFRVRGIGVCRKHRVKENPGDQLRLFERKIGHGSSG